MTELIKLKYQIAIDPVLAFAVPFAKYLMINK